MRWKLWILGQILEYFLFLYRQNKLTIKQAAALAIEKIFVFWKKTNIPVRNAALCEEA